MANEDFEPELMEQMKFLMDEAKQHVRLDKLTFVNKYLPMFTGKQADVDLREWLSVAGTPNHYVDIVDVSGKVIWTVPPLIVQSKTMVGSSGRFSLTEHIAIASRKMEISKQSGSDHLSAAIQPIIDANQVDIEHINMWNKIFVDNGYPPLLELKPNKVIDSGINEDDLEYEEL